MARHGSHVLSGHHGTARPALRNGMQMDRAILLLQLGQIIVGITPSPQKTPRQSQPLQCYCSSAMCTEPQPELSYTQLPRANPTHPSHPRAPLLTLHAELEVLGVGDHRAVQLLRDFFAQPAVTTLLLGLTPEVGATVHAGDVEDSDAFQGRVTQVQHGPVTLSGTRAVSGHRVRSTLEPSLLSPPAHQRSWAPQAQWIPRSILPQGGWGRRCKPPCFTFLGLTTTTTSLSLCCFPLHSI